VDLELTEEQQAAAEERARIRGIGSPAAGQGTRRDRTLSAGAFQESGRTRTLPEYPFQKPRAAQASTTLLTPSPSKNLALLRFDGRDSVGSNSLYCDPIHRYGTEDQKKRFLVPYTRGEKIGCYALTEPQAGSNAAALQTKAVKKGRRLRAPTARKPGFTNGGAADAAIVYVEHRAGER